LMNEISVRTFDVIRLLNYAEILLKNYLLKAILFIVFDFLSYSRLSSLQIRPIIYCSGFIIFY
jgi:hypothetical protein